MAFPLSAKYNWGYTTESRKSHFQTAPREHEDLEQIARILNNIAVEIVDDPTKCGIDKNGDHWKIKVYGKVDEGDISGDLDVALREVDVCVNGQMKKMKIMGSLPY